MVQMTFPSVLQLETPFVNKYNNKNFFNLCGFSHDVFLHQKLPYTFSLQLHY